MPRSAASPMLAPSTTPIVLPTPAPTASDGAKRPPGIPETVEASSRTDSSVFVIDLTDDALTYRQFLPIVATYDEPTLTVHGPFADPTCRAGEYAFVILDNVRDAAADARIGRSGAFDKAFEGDGPFAEVRLALVENGVELASVAGATIFAVSCP